MDSELNFAIRTAGDAADVVNAARAAIVRTSPEINIRQVQPLSEIVARSLARERALGMVAVLFSVVAVGLAAIGLYGVLAFQVASRSREIGIRMALGANASSVVRLVIRQSLVVVAAGIIAGVPLALAASTGLRALLYGIEPFAPLPLAIAAVVLVATGLVAALLPSRNAAGIDPLLAIRSE
jgi:ABC-type antimicrobial peptide transport system permease subunit